VAVVAVSVAVVVAVLWIGTTTAPEVVYVSRVKVGKEAAGEPVADAVAVRIGSEVKVAATVGVFFARDFRLFLRGAESTASESAVSIAAWLMVKAEAGLGTDKALTVRAEASAAAPRDEGEEAEAEVEPTPPMTPATAISAATARVGAGVALTVSW
jgi:hypothetical protein